MDLITLVVVLIVIGVLLALVNRFGPPWIDPTILRIINIAVVVAVVVWLLSLFVNFGSISTVRVGR